MEADGQLLQVSEHCTAMEGLHWNSLPSDREERCGEVKERAERTDRSGRLHRASRRMGRPCHGHQSRGVQTSVSDALLRPCLPLLSASLLLRSYLTMWVMGPEFPFTRLHSLLFRNLFTCNTGFCSMANPHWSPSCRVQAQLRACATHISSG
jgi:hypothetical protein